VACLVLPRDVDWFCGSDGMLGPWKLQLSKRSSVRTEMVSMFRTPSKHRD
jgi:hypothetical protein